HSLTIERAILHQFECAFHRRSRALPGRTKRCGLGAAAQARPKAGALSRGRARIETDIAGKRRPHPAYRPAIDACRSDRDEDDAVKGGIAPLERLVLRGKVEHIPSS